MPGCRQRAALEELWLRALHLWGRRGEGQTDGQPSGLGCKGRGEVLELVLLDTL